MRTFFQQNPPLTFGRAMLLKSEFDILDFPYSVIKIDMISHSRSSDIDYISILLNKVSLNDVFTSAHHHPGQPVTLISEVRGTRR